MTKKEHYDKLFEQFRQIYKEKKRNRNVEKTPYAYILNRETDEMLLYAPKGKASDLLDYLNKNS